MMLTDGLLFPASQKELGTAELKVVPAHRDVSESKCLNILGAACFSIAVPVSY